MRLFPLAVLIALACLIVPAAGVGADRPPRDRGGVDDTSQSSAEKLCGDVPSGVQCGHGR